MRIGNKAAELEKKARPLFLAIARQGGLRIAALRQLTSGKKLHEVVWFFLMLIGSGSFILKASNKKCASFAPFLVGLASPQGPLGPSKPVGSAGCALILTSRHAKGVSSAQSSRMPLRLKIKASL